MINKTFLSTTLLLLHGVRAASYWTVVGNPAYDVADEAASETTGTATVRCCSIAGDSCTSEWPNADGSILGGAGTEADGCFSDQTYAQAEAICSARGQRLCTKVEMDSGVCSGTGCGHDDDLVWTSTEAPTWERTELAQCFVSSASAVHEGDRTDNPVFNAGGYYGKTTIEECKALCLDGRTDPFGRPCVAIEFSQTSIDSDGKANCAFAWGCESTAGWSGGDVYRVVTANTGHMTMEVCANDGLAAAYEDMRCEPETDSRPVLCCEVTADNAPSDTCTSPYGNTCEFADHQTATEMCAAQGKRLCAAREFEDHVCCDSPCKDESVKAWTEHECGTEPECRDMIEEVIPGLTCDTASASLGCKAEIQGVYLAWWCPVTCNFCGGTWGPTSAPTRGPTSAPTAFPTKTPTKSPTKTPTKTPTKSPTKTPTKTPTKSPTKTPTKAPTSAPTDLVCLGGEDKVDACSLMDSDKHVEFCVANPSSWICECDDLTEQCPAGFHWKQGGPAHGLGCGSDTVTCHTNVILDDQACADICESETQCIGFTTDTNGFHGWCLTFTELSETRITQSNEAAENSGDQALYYCESEGEVAMSFAGNGCCRYDDWTATNIGYVTTEACKAACLSDARCVGADVARPSGDTSPDGVVYDCHLFYSSDPETINLQCDTTNPDEQCYSKASEASVTVSGITHPWGLPEGQYFYFTVAEWTELTGESGVSGVWVVDHYRNGALVEASLKVVVWDNYNGVHGRKDSGAAGGQWQIGDLIKNASPWTTRRLEGAEASELLAPQ